MDVAHAVEVFLLDAERAAHAAVILEAVPKRTVVGFEAVAAPGPPSSEFAFGCDQEIGARARGFLRRVVQVKLLRHRASGTLWS